MKKALISSFLTAFLVVTTVISVKAQPHAGQQSGGNVTGDRIGAGAGVPVGSGTLLLIGLSRFYGCKNVYTMCKCLEA